MTDSTAPIGSHTPVEEPNGSVPFVAVGLTILASFAALKIREYAKMLAELRNETPDQIPDQSDIYLAGMVRVALAADDRRTAERAAYDLYDLGIGVGSNFHTGAK